MLHTIKPIKRKRSDSTTKLKSAVAALQHAFASLAAARATLQSKEQVLLGLIRQQDELLRELQHLHVDTDGEQQPQHLQQQDTGSALLCAAEPGSAEGDGATAGPPASAACSSLVASATPEQWHRAITMTPQDWCHYFSNLVAQLSLLSQMAARSQQQQPPQSSGQNAQQASTSTCLRSASPSEKSSAAAGPAAAPGPPPQAGPHADSDASSAGGTTDEDSEDDEDGISAAMAAAAEEVAAVAAMAAMAAHQGRQQQQEVKPAADAERADAAAAAATTAAAVESQMRELAADFVTLVHLMHIVGTDLAYRQASHVDLSTGQRVSNMDAHHWEHVLDALQLTQEQETDFDQAFQQFQRLRRRLHSQQQQVARLLQSATDATSTALNQPLSTSLVPPPQHQPSAEGRASSAVAAPATATVQGAEPAAAAATAAPPAALPTEEQLSERLLSILAGTTAASAMEVFFVLGRMTHSQVVRMLIAAYPFLPRGAAVLEVLHRRMRERRAAQQQLHLRSQQQHLRRRQLDAVKQQQAGRLQMRPTPGTAELGGL